MPFLSIADTIIITTAEGIQRDHSYHQHGAQLYNQGYGSLFISNTLEWAVLSADTGFAFPEDQRRILADYLLDGTRWMNRGRMIDYTASGRGVSRKNQSANASGLGNLATSLLTVIPGYRTAELESLRASIIAANSSGVASPDLSHTGAKHFWRSDFTAWHRSAGYASVKISSTRTLQPESGNDEGLKNFHLADGVNLILRTGTEYNDIMPVWNWQKLPGTTIEQASYSLKPSSDWGVAGNSTYAGGISDGRNAATAFQYSRRNVSARKAWFFFDKGFVALGAGINAPSASSQVETTLNQSLLNGAVTYDQGGGPQPFIGGPSNLSGLQWVHHDGTAYFFNETPSSASLGAASQSGTWQSINGGYDSTPVTKDVFTLSVRHGTNVTGGKYAYTVVPGISAAETATYESALEILSNDTTVQAVSDTSTGLVQGAWHAAGSLTWEDPRGSRTLTAHGPVLAQFGRSSAEFPRETLRFSAASPEAKAEIVRLDLTGPPPMDLPDSLAMDTSVFIGLPGGDLAGSTAALHVSWEPTGSETLLHFHGSGAFTSLSATFAAPLTLLNAHPAIFDCDDVSATFSGPVSGPASLVKQGSGTLRFDGNAIFDGPTHVEEGTVLVAGSLETTNVVIGEGAVFKLGGELRRFARGDLIIDEGGVFEVSGSDNLTLKNLSGPGNLVRSGTGTLILRGETAHTGDTRIESGTLQIDHPVLADDANVYFTENGAIFLNFEGMDIVRALMIDGISQSAGTWGAPGSGAMYESSHISGTGFLLVTSIDPRETSELIHDTFDVGSPPTVGNDAADPLDTAWTATNFNLSLAEDSTIGTGRSLNASSTGSFSNLMGAFPAQTLARTGDTLRLSFDFRYTAVPGNNVGGFRFGFFNSNGGGYAVQHGTGGSTGYALLHGPDGHGAGSNTGGIFSANKTSINNTTKHHCVFEVRRIDTGFRLLGIVDGVEISTIHVPPATFVFNTVAIRNGSINASLCVDNVKVSTTTASPPFFAVFPVIRSVASPGFTYLEPLSDASDLTFTKLSGPVWLDVSAAGILSGTPEIADLGENLLVFRVTNPQGLTMEHAVLIPVVDHFQQWLDSHSSLTDRSETGDPDGDGLPNLVEYALGLDPLVANPPAQIVRENDRLSLVYPFVSRTPGTILTAEWSDDLKIWHDDLTEITEENDTLQASTLAGPSISRRFLRLKVTRP